MTVQEHAGQEHAGTIRIKVGERENCADCQHNGQRAFCNLSKETLAAFNEIARMDFCPRGTRLFWEGQTSQGVFILCTGQAKLSISSSRGKSLMRVAERGEILGLSATLSGQPYEGSAEMLDGGQVKFVRRDLFLGFLREHGAASLRAAESLSHDYQAVYEQVRAVALSDSVAEKLAKLLLYWCSRQGKETEHGIHLKLSLTHGEIAQMIGVSRETVTRLISEFRVNRVIELKGSNLFVPNKAALERLVNS